jgi:hypothetical protein
MTHLTRAECLRGARKVLREPLGSCAAVGVTSTSVAVLHQLGSYWPDFSPQSQAERCLFLCFLAYAPIEFRRVG